MGQMKWWSDILKSLTMIGQLGLSLIMPLLLCLAGCWWLNTHTAIGIWIYLPGFFFGLGGSGMTAYKFYLSMDRRARKEVEKEKKISFNSHV